jgi:hypothetical protein
MDLTVTVPDDGTPRQLQRWRAEIENLVPRWRAAERLPVAPAVTDTPQRLEGAVRLSTEPTRMPDHSRSQRVQLHARAANAGDVLVYDHRPGPTSSARLRLSPGQRGPWLVVANHGMSSLWVAGEHDGDSVAFVSDQSMG